MRLGFSRFSWVLAGLLVVVSAGLAVTTPGGAKPFISKAAAAGTGWTTYHHDNSREGLDPNSPALSVTTPSRTWNMSTDAAIYAEPLAFAGRVYVATMGDSVYAYDAASGTLAWHDTLGTAVTQGFCSFSPGHIGIMGTPVIDPSSNILYAVGLVSSPSLRYRMFAVNLADGSAVAGFPVDLTPSGFVASDQNQRAALALANGHVYVAFGGWLGDCGTYHPVVMSVPTSGGSVDRFWNPQSGCQNGVGIWGPSGIAADPLGSLYVATGNGTGCYGSGSYPCTNSAWDWGDGVVKLSSTLAAASTWAPNNSTVSWCGLSSSDTDIGSIGPAILPNLQIFQTGKPGYGWMLNAANLGGFNGQEAQARLGSCHPDATFGGLAYYNSHVYVPCDGVGLVAISVDTAHGTFSGTPAWTNGSFSPGPPIAAMGLIWDQDQGGSDLYGLDPLSGSVRVHVSLSGGSNHFATLAEDGGRIFVPHGTTITGLDFNSPPPQCGSAPCLLYTLDGYGGVQPNAGLAGVGQTAYWQGWDIARGLVITPDSAVGSVKGYTLDGWGGLHPFGGAAAVSNNAYTPNQDIFKGIAWAPGDTSASPGGWTLDAYGGVHPFGNAGSPGATAYWTGWNIARGIAILPDSTAAAPAGYTLDGWGGLHPFGGAPAITNNAYWQGWDIARGIVLAPWATRSNVAGWTLDGWGGVHPFGSAVAVPDNAYWPGWDIARGLVILPGSQNPVKGYNLDGWGGLHPFGGAPPVSGPYWYGWDIARGTADQGMNSGARHP